MLQPMRSIDFWFDFISPYAYFAAMRIGALAAKHAVAVRFRPVLFAGLLNHHGQLGPAEIPSKREHTFKDIVRFATLHNIELTGPAAHPFNPVTALRCALPEVAKDRQPDVIRALFVAGWGRGADLGDPAAIAKVLEDAGLDGSAMVAATRAPEVKQALKNEVAQAIERGVFGVPTVDCEGELFWGNDRLEYVALRLEGRDPLDPGAIQRLLEMPTGSTRPRPPQPGRHESDSR